MRCTTNFVTDTFKMEFGMLRMTDAEKSSNVYSKLPIGV